MREYARKREASKNISEAALLFAVGGGIYYFMEIAFRGFSHWSMFAAGGMVLVFCAFQGKAMHWTEGIWVQVLRGTVFVTSVEFITGIIVNKWLRLGVWDYGDQPFNLWGQICVPFAVLFSGLVVLAVLLGGSMMHLIYREEKPRFHVL